jgi:hypothetical protein
MFNAMGYLFEHLKAKAERGDAWEPSNTLPCGSFDFDLEQLSMLRPGEVRQYR